jgi:hypothetical protein
VNDYSKRIKKVRRIIAVVGIILSISLPAYLFFTIDPFFKNLKTHLAAYPIDGVSLKTLTDFRWDYVCMFHGYDNPPADVTLKEAGIEIPADHRKAIKDIQDISDIRLFVFSLKGKVVRTAYLGTTGIKVKGHRYSIENVISMKQGDRCHGVDAEFSYTSYKNTRGLVFTEQLDRF